ATQAGRWRWRRRRTDAGRRRIHCVVRMAQVMPELRRVLDGDIVPAGLSESDLLELYRRMVLLRTYDERSLVYHRQGRLGTYAMFWNHEAIQAGATFALTDE